MSERCRRRRFAMALPVLLVAGCGGTPLPGEKSPPPDFTTPPDMTRLEPYQPTPVPLEVRAPTAQILMVQYQPAPVPPRMTPPKPPAHPPTPLIKDYGQWQREENHFRFVPGAQTDPIAHSPIWVPGRWTNDSSGNRAWIPGYWR